MVAAACRGKGRERERVNVNSIFFLLGIDGGFEGCW